MLHLCLRCKRNYRNLNGRTDKSKKTKVLRRTTILLGVALTDQNPKTNQILLQNS